MERNLSGREKSTNRSSLANQKELSVQGFKLLEAGLQVDTPHATRSAREFALQKYCQGVDVLQQALSIHFEPSEREHAYPLIEKMKQNVELVEDRVRTLTRELSSCTPKEKKIATTRTTRTTTTAITGDKRIRGVSHRRGSRSGACRRGSDNTGSHGNIRGSEVPLNRKRDKTNTISREDSRKEVIGSSSTTSLQTKGIDPKLADVVLSNLVEHAASVTWEDVVGLEGAKKALNEMVILPTLRPDIFCGLRAPPRGLLLFGPPGNGKTLIAKALANEAHARFFNVSAASLTSKYLGEGEKLVRTLFGIAREVQPSIVFIDEIDSLLSERSDKEHEASRRLKTEFLVQLDGVTSSQEDRVIVVGATNTPHTLDEAARRRLGKRIYVPLPDPQARRAIIKKLLKGQKAALSDHHLDELAVRTHGYSGSDLANLCKEAAFEPVRDLGPAIRDTPLHNLRPIQMKDFIYSLSQIRPSVDEHSLKAFEEWNSKFGCVAG